MGRRLSAALLVVAWCPSFTISNTARSRPGWNRVSPSRLLQHGQMNHDAFKMYCSIYRALVSYQIMR
jgi:hypothetical protein